MHGGKIKVPYKVTIKRKRNCQNNDGKKQKVIYQMNIVFLLMKPKKVLVSNKKFEIGKKQKKRESTLQIK